MDNIGSSSQPNNRDNEDFVFNELLGSARLFVVGDFAESDFVGIDVTTTGQLEQLVKDPNLIEVANDSLPVGLAYLASLLNEQLVSFAGQTKAKFQCSVMFAATRGAELYYLPIGDCRIAINRNKNLLLLNESVWVDGTGAPLGVLVAAGQTVVKSNEDPPAQALGIANVNFSYEQVKTWSLQPSDLILLYSDGVDKFVSPVRMLELLQAHVAEDSLQQLADRIIYEARLQHGNDDRSVLIAAGPFVKEEASAVTLVREEMDALEKKLTQRITSMEEQNVSLESLVRNLQSVSQQIWGRTQQLATASEVKANSGGNATAEGLGRIEQTIANLEGAITSIQNNLGISTKQKSKKGKSNHEVIPVVQTESSPAAPSPICDFTPDGPVREGVIHVGFGSYELIDDRFAVDKDGRTTEKYLAPAPEARPGWFTAFYLHLRLQPQPPKDAEAEQIKEWIREQTEAFDKASAMKDSELRALRNQHWELRDKRRRMPLFRMEPEILIAEEKKLIQGEPQSPNPPDNTYAPQAVVNDPSNLFEKLTEPRVMVPLILVIALFVVGLLYLMASDQITNTSDPITPTPASDPAKLEYGADGRTLLAVVGGKPQPLKYRIAVGKELAFQNQIPPQQFASLKRLIERIETEAAELVLQQNDPDVVPADRALMKVDETDLSGAGTGNEKCERFLKRVNPQLPVRNELQDLTQLNPNLRCKDLTSEHFLVVKAPPPPTTSRRRRR